jgi:integrase
MTYSKLPDKEIIRAALDIASPVMKPIILFMCSSGCARTETLNLTIQDYIESTKEYHNSNNIYEIIETLNQIDNVVPTFNILRQKTNKYYTTFCSPEAVNSINNYLLSRENLTKESKLFKINKSYFNLKFIEINNELGLGKVGTFNRFRSHMLRKFHASTLMNDGMSRETVNDLQGKKKNAVDEVYFYNNPETLKEEYIQHLPALTIMQEVEKITIKSPEVQRMELENKELKDNVKDILARLHNLEQIKWEDIK